MHNFSDFNEQWIQPIYNKLQWPRMMQASNFESESKYLRQTTDTFMGRLWQRYYFYEGEMKLKYKHFIFQLTSYMREQYAFFSKVAFGLGAFLAVDAYILGFLSNWFYRETEFFFAFLSICAAYACLFKQREADQKIAVRSIKPITDQFRSKDQMISDMKKRVEHDLRSEYNNSGSKARRYSPIRSADRASIFGGHNDEFTVRKQREVDEDRRRSATMSGNKRDEPMSMTASAMKADPSWQQAISPLIKPRNPTGPQVEYVYLNTFDPVQNDREASRALSQNTCYMG